ncbi:MULTISPECIES: WcaI family glycosyltransferase [Olivibacter]|uniref:WcaI family glycosyltransferase n=1 Tax=Olivibacter jilunii TaxID=985016 RepID=A0ABW6B4S3_9SPHI
MNYAPELTGIGKYTGEMGSWFAQRGHKVAVVTAMPYYPEWRVHKDYSKRGWHKEIIDNAEVFRVPIYVPKNVNSVKRIIHELSFIVSVFPIWFTFLFKRKYDIVVNINPPFHLGLYPFLYSKLRNAKLVTHIQDLQIDAAKDLQMIKNKALLNFMFKFEKSLLQRSDMVTSISIGMRRKIIAKQVPEDKFRMFPNWVDSKVITPLSQRESLRIEWGIPFSDKVILYAGNLGEKQGLESIITIAERLKNLTNVHFVIVGSGAGREKLEGLAIGKGLSNVKFFPLQPYEKLSALLASADLHLVLQKKSASDLVMPSKLTSILASGGCAIVTAIPGSSLYDVIHENTLGILTEPENEEALMAGILTALNSDLKKYRDNARNYAATNLDKNQILTRFEKDLQELTDSKK